MVGTIGEGFRRHFGALTRDVPDPYFDAVDVTESVTAPAIDATYNLDEGPMVSHSLILKRVSDDHIYTEGTDYLEDVAGGFKNLAITAAIALEATYWVTPSETSGTGVTDHGALSGLGDDDHTQYYDQTRGDARYVRITGDPSDGQWFSWDEASGTLVPENAPVSGGAGYRTPIILASDQSNSTTTFADIPGLTLSVTSGSVYRFEFLIVYDVPATTTAGFFSLNGPAFTFLGYITETFSSTTSQNAGMFNTYDQFLSTSVSAFTSGNLARIHGIVKPSASGTLAARFKSEVAASAVTVKAGSTLEYW